MLLALLIAVAPQVPLLPGGGVDWFGDIRAQPGAWVEYAIVRPGKPQARLKASILAPAPSADRRWLEIVTEEQGRPPTAVRMLLTGAGTSAQSIQAISLYVAGQAPVSLPARSMAPPQRKPDAVKRLGSEVVTLAIGRFHCDVSSLRGMRMDHSAHVPLWGLVRAVRREMRLELIGFGESGAVSVFPEAFVHGTGSDSANE